MVPFTFGLIGAIVGACAMYFGYGAWPAAPALVVIAALTQPRVASTAGALIGLGAGSALLLWIGTRCPADTICDPYFAIEHYIGFAAVSMASGLALTVIGLIGHFSQTQN